MQMPKYLLHGSYTAAGAAGVLKDGGMGRVAAIEELITSLGGSVESNYWAFGRNDFFVVVEMPDAEAAVAASLTMSASGAASVTMTSLISAAELDEAVSRTAEYRPPGT